MAGLMNGQNGNLEINLRLMFFNRNVKVHLKHCSNHSFMKLWSVIFAKVEGF